MKRVAITRNLMNIMGRMSDGLWWEWSDNSFTPAHEAIKRAIKLCIKYGWMEEGPAVQPGFKAYRVTPRGLAIYDQF